MIASERTFRALTTVFGDWRKCTALHSNVQTDSHVVATFLKVVRFRLEVQSQASPFPWPGPLASLVTCISMVVSIFTGVPVCQPDRGEPVRNNAMKKRVNKYKKRKRTNARTGIVSRALTQVKRGREDQGQHGRTGCFHRVSLGKSGTSWGRWPRTEGTG